MLFGMRELSVPSFGQPTDPDPPAQPTSALAEAVAAPSVADTSVADSAATSIGPLPDRAQARAWALVLQSQNIAFILTHAAPLRAMLDDERTVEVAPGGWLLRVAPHDYERALSSIEIYEEENENWPPPRVKDTPRHDSSPLVLLGFVALALFFLYVTGPSARGSAWFTHGRADASRLFSEPWRMITALTLHADAQHVIGNAISGTIFGTMVARRIGPGGALLAILLSGIIGNTLNAIYHLQSGHLSIGASTAVFGAVGLLAALQTMIDWGRRSQERRRWRVVDVLAPLIGGLALLGALGAGGGNTDVWAHGFGFAAGVGIGLLLGRGVRRDATAPSNALQVLTGAGAAVIVVTAWALALAT
jgi:membrane associated rhomboid family serine protease